MKHETAGDPVTGCKWSRKSTYTIARQLKRLKISLSASTIGRLLKVQHFCLHKNRKNIEGTSGKKVDPHRRNRQFLYIKRQRQRRAFIDAGGQSAVIFGYSAPNEVEFYVLGYSGANPRPGSAIVLPDAEWHHLAYSYDGTNWVSYRDGLPIANLTRTFSLNTAGNDWLVGSRLCQCRSRQRRRRFR